MESESSEDVSSAKAVLLGALAPGVNGPTWITLKLTFLMMGLCLVVMLGLAFSSSDSPLMLHVTFLVLICVTLFLLLSWFLAQTGLVSVEHQMREMGLVQNDNLETTRKSNNRVLQDLMRNIQKHEQQGKSNKNFIFFVICCYGLIGGYNIYRALVSLYYT